MKVAPIRVFGPERFIDTFALFDEGSTATLIDKKLTRDIGVRGPRLKITLRGVTRAESTFSNCEKVCIQVQGAFEKYLIKNAIAIADLKIPVQPLSEEIVRSVKSVKNVNVQMHERGAAQMVIGQDNWELIISRVMKEVCSRGLAISRTLLGWVIHGYFELKNPGKRENHSLFSISAAPTVIENIHLNDSLDELVRKYFLLDNLDINNPRTAAKIDSRAERILSDSRYIAGKGWETGLLWRSEVPPVVNSEATARSRLRSLERKLDNDPALAAIYYKEMDRLINCGYAEKVQRGVMRERLWYLPHFGVRNANKPGKIRLVFDAAAETEGVSLNSQLDAGSDLLESLLGVLIRFRQFDIAIKGDVKDMFLRVKVKENDRGAQRFLWRGRDRDRPPAVYEMTCLIFGAKSSPCSAIYIKNRNASRFAQSKPDAAASIKSSSYMD